MAISSIILTENNLSQSGTFDPQANKGPYNRFYLQMPNQGNLKDYQIALQKINMYYSFPNIDSSNSSAALIEWPVGAGISNFNWNLTQNFNYGSIQELNDAIQNFCIINGLYLISSTGQNVYYIELKSNPNSYGVDLTLYKIPSSLPVGWTQPSNWVGYPTISQSCQITFKSQFNKLIGFPLTPFNAGVSASQTWTSSFCPQLSPTSSILVSCNIAFNPLAVNGSASIMNVFTTRGTTYGSLVVAEPQELIWYDINCSSSNFLIVEFYNQDFMPLNLLDPQTTIQLLLRPKVS